MKVLITGSSAGFGKLIAETLLKEGYEVAASMRGVHGKNKTAASDLLRAGAKVVEIDVVDCESVDNGVKDAIQALGGLDVVINNAGAAAIGLHETFTIEDWKKIFEVNLFGVQRVNRASLPFLREQGSGLLVHVSSTLGRVSLPFFGPYTASKWALEALAEGYRAELSGFGVESVVVEPGGFATEIFDKMAYASDIERAKAFGEFADAPRKFFESFGRSLAENPNQKPQDVADAISKLIATPAGERPFRTIVDKMGMKDAVAPYNEAHEKLTRALYKAFGMGAMLELKTREKIPA